MTILGSSIYSAQSFSPVVHTITSASTSSTTSSTTSCTNAANAESRSLVSSQLYSQRRDFLSSMMTITAATATTLANPFLPVANAAESATITEKLKPNFTQGEIASFLRPIPTFAIVDKKGVPYMVVGEDAKLSAYFFTTYEESNRILKRASVSADKALLDLKKEENEKRKSQGLPPYTSKVDIEENIGINPWKDGRVSAIPLDFSVSLASRGKIAGSYFRIAPNENDIQDALDIEKSITDLAEGKVPLFFIDDFEIATSNASSNASSSTSTQIPLYFSKSQLLEEYKKQSKNKDQKPVIKVTELFSILGEMAGTGDVDQDLKKLTLVPPIGSLDKAKLCEKKGGTESPYKIGERIVVL